MKIMATITMALWDVLQDGPPGRSNARRVPILFIQAHHRADQAGR